MRVWTNANIATMTDGGEPYGAVRDGALVVHDGKIAWVGPRRSLPQEYSGADTEEAGGRWITPGLIDCHTHLVYGGDRAGEFEQRLNGASYEEIARAGGGIVSTVKATRAADSDALYEQSRPRLVSLLAEGVTTVEIKSGYGLERDGEMRMLQVARRHGDELPVTVRTTFLGAHALPPEFSERSDDYIDAVCNDMLPAVANAGLADAVDAFCESIGFSPAQTERVFLRARELGLPVKLHAEQLSDLSGAALAAGHGALSADHLEYVSEDSVKAMAAAGTVAVLLPGAFYFLRETRKPPVELFRAHGVPMALAPDCNPGSSPVTSLLLMLSMACTFFGLTSEEALAGVTCNGARALGMAGTHGTLEPGKVADFVLWDIDEPAQLAYNVGLNRRAQTVYGGKPVAIPGTRG
ncbi:MAG: imidazolonepropionase [Gammaproteobacteria bacterium]